MSGDPDQRNRIGVATQQISHRGPDHREVFQDENIALGHTRLSIVDLSDNGNQPMTCRQTNRTLVFNGEIYNFKDLREELRGAGYEFIGQSDSEVILHGFDHWGPLLFQKLNGIFAFGIWDPNQSILTLCRDRFGVKPLYMFEENGTVVFASEIKSILEVVPEKCGTLDFAALHEFCYYGVALGNHTFFSGIEEIPPGTWASWKQGTKKSATYWDLPAFVTATPSSEDTLVDETRTLLEKAVAKQLTGDVPIGVFLSGGLDSSTITAFASKHYPGRLQTFSVAFDFCPSSELDLARLVANRFATEHHEVSIKGANVANVVTELVRHHDSPFSDAANIPLYLLSKQISGQIKVVLQGDGGDEFFGGYRRYASLTRDWQLHKTTKLISSLGLQKILPTRVRRYVDCFVPRERALRFARLLTMDPMYPPPTQILSKSAYARIDDYDPFLRYRRVAAEYAHLDAVQAMLMCDVQIILPDVFLEKVDKSTMANGLEVRVPLLENDLTQHLLTIPSNQKVKRGEKKWLLKQAIRGIVPDEVIDAPKSGFGVPYSQWLRGPLYDFARDTINSDAVRQSGILDLSHVNSLMVRHRQGKENNGFLLWKTLNLAIWLEEYRVSA